MVTNIRQWGIPEATWSSATPRSVALGIRVMIWVVSREFPCDVIIWGCSRRILGWTMFRRLTHAFVGRVDRQLLAIAGSSSAGNTEWQPQLCFTTYDTGNNILPDQETIRLVQLFLWNKFFPELILQRPPPPPMSQVCYRKLSFEWLQYSTR